jgi:hypothetical protein
MLLSVGISTATVAIKRGCAVQDWREREREADGHKKEMRRSSCFSFSIYTSQIKTLKIKSRCNNFSVS